MTGVPTKATVSPTIAGKGACPQKIKAVLIAITRAGWITRKPITRDDRNSMEDRMRDVMSHYSIPSDVNFDQIASNNNQGYGVHRRPDQEGNNDDRGQRGYRDREWQSRLSAKDQHRFDTYYSRWLEARETGDRHQTANMEKRMLGLMARYSIPPDSQFSQIASGSIERNRRH